MTFNPIDIIQTINEHYVPLTEECMLELASCASFKQFNKQHIIIKEGQHSDQLFFIINGCLRAYYLKDGKEITDWFAFENDFICAINSYFNGIPSPHYIESVEPSTVLAIGKNDIDKLCDKYHCMEKLARASITKTMLHLQRRIVALQFETAQQKYENLLAERPDITLRVPLSQIASHLGITLETLSRIRNARKRN